MSEQIPVQVFADDTRVELLAAYTDHMDDLVAVYQDAVAGDAELVDRAPAEGCWSVAQIVHHLADYEMTHSLDVRRLLVEDRPTLSSWDQDAYATQLLYDVRPPDDALTLVLAQRHLNSRLLAVLPPLAWTRCALTPEGSEIDLGGLVRAAADHLAAHVLQARRAVLGMI